MRVDVASGTFAVLLGVLAFVSCAGGDDTESSSGGGGHYSFGGAGGFGASGGSGGASGGTTPTGGTGGATGGTGADAAVVDVFDANVDSGACGLNPNTADAGCAAGQYWNPCKAQCVPCSDLTWIVPGEPLALLTALSSGTGGKDQLYPRVADLGGTTRVVLSQSIPESGPNETQLATATLSGSSWTGFTMNLGSLVNYPDADDSAPIAIPKGIVDPLNGSPAPEAFVLFESKRDGNRKVFSSALFKGSGSPAALGPPVNDPVAGSRDYSPAYAYAANPPRLYWVSDRNTSFGLYTVAVTGGSVAKVPLTLESGCPVTDEDVEPWVSPDGYVLLFTSPRREQPNCAAPAAGGARSIYVAYMDVLSGQQIGPARELLGLRAALATKYNNADVALRTPSLGPGLCTLYFSSDADTASGADFDVFTATR